MEGSRAEEFEKEGVKTTVFYTIIIAID